MTKVEVKTHHWSRVQYDRLIAVGFFQPRDPIELIGGQLVVAEPQGTYHFTAIQAGEEVLRATFRPGWQRGGEGPVGLDDESEPEPDAAGAPRGFPAHLAGHPSRPGLAVAASETSL